MMSSKGVFTCSSTSLAPSPRSLAASLRQRAPTALRQRRPRAARPDALHFPSTFCPARPPNFFLTGARDLSVRPPPARFRPIRMNIEIHSFARAAARREICDGARRDAGSRVRAGVTRRTYSRPHATSTRRHVSARRHVGVWNQQLRHAGRHSGTARLP